MPQRIGVPAALARSVARSATSSSCVSTHSHDRNGSPWMVHVGCRRSSSLCVYARHCGVISHVFSMYSVSSTAAANVNDAV